MIKSVADNLLTNAPNESARARLLASATKKSGSWLNVILLSSCGLHMDNISILVLKLTNSLPMVSVVVGVRVVLLSTQPSLTSSSDP